MLINDFLTSTNGVNDNLLVFYEDAKHQAYPVKAAKIEGDRQVVLQIGHPVILLKHFKQLIQIEPHGRFFILTGNQPAPLFGYRLDDKRILLG